MEERAKTLWNQLCADLNRFKPGERFFSVRRVMERYGATRQAVDAALAEMERTGLVELRPRSGIYVLQNHARRRIVYLYPDWPDESQRIEVSILQRLFEESSEFKLISQPFDYQREVLSLISEYDADLILVGWPARPIRPDELCALALAPHPVMVIGRDLRDASLHCTFVDVIYNALQTVRYLYQCGHRKFGLLLAEPPVGGNIQYMQCVSQVAETMGCTVYPVPCASQDGNYAPEIAHQAMTAYLQEHHRPEFSAMIVVSGTAVKGALLACSENAIRVPEDLSVLASGSGEVCRFFTPPITVLAEDYAENGRKLLAEVARFFRDPSSGPITVAHRAVLTIRKSVRNLTPDQP